ncbi:MAG: VOC family protein [Spirochaetaceae bacterium]
MKINHIAFWVKDLEKMKDFYQRFFNCTSGDKYVNSKKFSSYFLTFDSGVSIELMTKPYISNKQDSADAYDVFGYAHIAISVGSKEIVNSLTERLRSAEYGVVGEVRTTGDGYYESVILDPEGNKIEITI